MICKLISTLPLPICKIKVSCWTEKGKHRFMESLKWVDQTYMEKHASEDPATLRKGYFVNLLQWGHLPKSRTQKSVNPTQQFLMRGFRKALISIGVYLLSFLPIVGRFVLPAASF